MSDEKVKQEILRDAEALERGIDRKLQETEWEDQEVLQDYQETFGELSETQRRVAEAGYRQRLRAIKGDRALMASLKKRGMSPEKFARLTDENPHAYQQVYSEGVESLLDRLEGKGQKPKDPFFHPEAGAPKPPPKNVEKARQRAAKSKGSDDDIDAVLAALMGWD